MNQAGHWLQARVDALRERQRLREMGELDDPDIPPSPDPPRCPYQKCSGIGWTSPKVPVGHPDFGKSIPCDCAIERSASEQTDRLRKYADLGAREHMTFAVADPNGLGTDPDSSRLFREALEVCVQYAETPEGWLVIAGPNGSGKTHLAVSIANRLIERGEAVLFVHVPDLLDDLRSAFSPSSEFSYSELFERILEAPVLALDGLGAQSSTPWAMEKLQQVFNRRADSRRPTIITTASAIDEVDPYLASRMTNSRLSRIISLGEGVSFGLSSYGAVPPPLLARMSFDTFSIAGNQCSAAQRASLDTARDAAQNFARHPVGSLVLFGKTGVGKTHLAVSIAGHQLANGVPVYYAYVPSLLDRLRASFAPGNHLSFTRAFSEVLNASLLVLDDFGGHAHNEWSSEKLTQIIVHRHDFRLPTVVTTRLNVEGSDGPAISRLTDAITSSAIKMDVPDYRSSRQRKTAT